MGYIFWYLFIFIFVKGRGNETPAFTHSLETEHHIYLNLTTKLFYCLPDNYEVIDSSLNDIVLALDPEFSDGMKFQLADRIYR